MAPEAQEPAGAQDIAGPPGAEPPAQTAPPAPPQTPTPPPTTPEPPSSPAAPTGVVPGEGQGLTGDGAPRDEQSEESAPGAELPSEERLAEMLEESKAVSADPDEYEVEEPTVMGTAHVVQDNVSWQDDDPDTPEHERSDAHFAGGVTQQDNVTVDGEQRTVQADRTESVHAADSGNAAAPADAPLDPTLSRGTLDPDG